jgi:SAM-dependent methyltransferase
LLDVGCGAGLLLSLVRRRGFEVMGVDVSPHAVRLAAAQDDIPVQAGTLDAARFPAGHFDIVTMFHILEHVTDPRAALQEAGRVLQPHGKLILQVPNIRSWQCRMFRTRWHGLDIPRHTIDFSPRSLVRLLAACGFHVERMRNFNLRDNAPAFASSVAPWLDPMRRASRPTLKRTEGRISAWMMHLVYLGLVALSYPFALLEAAAGCGATLMVEARKV